MQIEYEHMIYVQCCMCVQYSTALPAASTVKRPKNNATHTKTMKLNVTSFQPIVCSQFLLTPTSGDQQLEYESWMVLAWVLSCFPLC